VRDLCEAQVAAGHLVGIVCDSETGGAYEDRLFDEIRDFLPLAVRRTPMQRQNGVGDAGAAWRAYRTIADLQPEVLHGHSAKGGAYARLFGTLMRLSGRPVARIYSPHGGSLHYDSARLSSRFFFRLEGTMDRFCDHMIFVADYERQAFAEKIGAPHSPWSIVHNGLRDAEFTAVPAAADAADFLYIGMMRDLKGPDLFLDALSQVERTARRPLRAMMVGDGEDLPRYVAQAVALGLGDRVTFRPAMPAREAFALARVMVVPSRAEAMPYIVLEGLAAGKPIVATNVGGIPEIFAGHENALATPDVSSLARRMSQALAEEQTFRRLMPPQRDLRARFGIDVMAASVERIYREALQCDKAGEREVDLAA
jgi:glycosyltransferase involved in cell wall biosynthesis